MTRRKRTALARPNPAPLEPPPVVLGDVTGTYVRVPLPPALVAELAPLAAEAHALYQQAADALARSRALLEGLARLRAELAPPKRRRRR